MSKLKIGIVDAGFYSLQAQLLKEGHHLTVFVDGSPELSSLTPEQFNVSGFKTGSIKPVSSFEEVLEAKPDLVILGTWENSTQGYYYEHCKFLGIPAIGYSGAALLLERDRNFAKLMTQRHVKDVKIPKSRTFTDREEALEFAKKTKKAWVLKQHVSSPHDVMTLRTVVARSSNDSVPLLSQANSAWFQENKGGVIFEEFIAGQEVCFGSWFNGEKFVGPIYSCIEHKGAQNSGRGGVLTGEVGTTIKWHQQRNNRLTRIFDGIATYLKGKCTGMVDINTILTEKGEQYLIEYTCRFGCPTIEVMIASQTKDNLGDHMLSVAKGLCRETIYDEGSYFNGISVFQYGYPLLNSETPVTVPFEMPKGAIQIDAKCVDGQWTTCYNDRQYVVVGKGTTEAKAVVNSYSLLENAQIPFGCTYRDDIGANLEKLEQDLVKWKIV